MFDQTVNVHFNRRRNDLDCKETLNVVHLNQIGTTVVLIRKGSISSAEKGRLRLSFDSRAKICSSLPIGLRSSLHKSGRCARLTFCKWSRMAGNLSICSDWFDVQLRVFHLAQKFVHSLTPLAPTLKVPTDRFQLSFPLKLSHCWSTYQDHYRQRFRRVLICLANIGRFPQRVRSVPIVDVAGWKCRNPE